MHTADVITSIEDVASTSAISFRPLNSGDRASIKETYLRIVTAKDGERLSDLAQRTGNVWSVQETAIANGIASHQALKAGQLVKIAGSRPYGGGG